MQLHHARAGGLAAAASLLLAAPAALAAQPLPVAASPEAVGFSSERLQRLDAFADRIVADGEVAGVSTLLARHGKVVEVRTHGVADITTKAPLRRDAIFRIFSMSKPITGVAMMILFEQGKWRLDDPVSKYIPEFKDLKVLTGVDASGKPILEPLNSPPTMRQLMSHTAGFSYGFDPTSPVDKIYQQKDVLGSHGLQEMITKLGTTPLLYQPGDRWVYSASVDIQGYLVEKLSGQRFGDFLQQHIFTPLKMTDTAFLVPREKIGRLSAVYSTDPGTGRLVDASSRNGQPARDYTQPPNLESGGGGLLSTIDDYARFAQMLANGGELDGVRILAPATVELMHTTVVPRRALEAPGSQFSEYVSFGLDAMVVNNPRKAGRLEGAGTFSWEGAAGTIFWVDPSNDVVFVAMLQNFTRAGPNNSIDAQARPLVYQALVDPAK